MLVKIGATELIERGVSAEVKVTMVQLRHDGSRYHNWTQAQEGLKTNRQRLLIPKLWLAKHPDHRMLVVVEHIEHAKAVMRHLPIGLAAEYHGGVSNRAEVLVRFQQGELQVLVVNEVAMHGLNLRDLHSIVYLRGGVSPVWLTQFIGRGQRLKTSGPQVIDLVDVYDDCAFLQRHSDTRLVFYEQSGYPVEKITFSTLYHGSTSL